MTGPSLEIDPFFKGPHELGFITVHSPLQKRAFPSLFPSKFQNPQNQKFKAIESWNTFPGYINSQRLSLSLIVHSSSSSSSPSTQFPISLSLSPSKPSINVFLQIIVFLGFHRSWQQWNCFKPPCFWRGPRHRRSDVCRENHISPPPHPIRS